MREAMRPHADRLDASCVVQGVAIAPYAARTVMIADGMDRECRAPFHRMIAATACDTGGDLFSKDVPFDSRPTLPGWKGRLWA